MKKIVIMIPIDNFIPFMGYMNNHGYYYTMATTVYSRDNDPMKPSRLTHYGYEVHKKYAAMLKLMFG